MKWIKDKLSLTDAQRKTSGRKVPYLRFTQRGNAFNVLTYFRTTFFSGQTWTVSTFGRSVVEECTIVADVVIAGQPKGKRTFTITHNPRRANSNKAPTTWLHYDAATLADLNAGNYYGHQAELERKSAGQFVFTIF